MLKLHLFLLIYLLFFSSIAFSLPSGLIARWAGEGNAIDSVNGSNGNIQGGVSFTEGKIGQAFAFNGTDGFINVPNNSIIDMGTSSFTIGLWVKTNDFSLQTLVEKRTANAEYLIDIGSNGHVRAGIVDANNNFALAGSSVSVVDGNFHHIALVRTASTTDKVDLFIDGALNATATFNGLLDISNSGDLTIGVDITGARFLNGALDDIQFYNRALSVFEVESIASASVPEASTSILLFVALFSFCHSRKIKIAY